MQKIVIFEYTGRDSLDFDIYNSFGNIVYKKNDPLTPDIMLKLSMTNIYRYEEDGPLVSKTPPKTPQKPKQQEKALTSVYAKEIADYLVDNTKKILNQVENGEIPDNSVCEATRKIIIDEIDSKIDEVESINQFRIIDDYTFSHAINVSSLCAAIAMKFDFSDKEIEDITLAGLLHDIGKSKIDKEILMKPKPLAPKELEIMKQHTSFGYDIIKNQLELPEKIALVALEHQEKYGGNGYPRGLKGKEISLFAQIATIADVYDALVSKRVYKDPMLPSDALKIMLSDGSKAFNPFILYKFVYLVNYRNTETLVEKDSLSDDEISQKPLTDDRLD